MESERGRVREGKKRPNSIKNGKRKKDIKRNKDEMGMGMEGGVKGGPGSPCFMTTRSI